MVRLDLSTAGFDQSDGAVVNLTALNAEAPGFLTAYPCDAGTPDTSNLNVMPGDVVSNATIVGTRRRPEPVRVLAVDASISSST